MLHPSNQHGGLPLDLLQQFNVLPLQGTPDMDTAVDYVPEYINIKYTNYILLRYQISGQNLAKENLLDYRGNTLQDRG